jgi:hypothetical protein
MGQAMTETRTRRPLPALIALLALTILTALVWWRVLNRDPGSSASAGSCPSGPTVTVLPQPSTLTVSVLNSTTRTGLARTTAEALQKRGFSVGTVTNDTKRVAGVAEIRYSSDEKPGATLLTYYFPGATLVPLPSPATGKLVVSLGAKFKTLASTSGVTAAMTAAHVSVQSPGSAGIGTTC